MGPCLTDAAPEAAPGELFVEEPLRGGPNINLSDRCGSLHRWVHVHISTARDGTLGIGIRANTKVVPMMRLVKIICSLFDARRGAPFMHKSTSSELTVPPGGWIAIAGSE